MYINGHGKKNDLAGMKRKKEIVKYERVVSILEEVAFHVKFIYCLWIAKTVHLIPWIYILTENPFLKYPFLLDRH